MKEKNQAEWIYEVLGKKKGILGASIRELTDADEKKIREEMLRYWKEHNDESTEFLVNGAVLCCSRGSDYSTLNSADHGVYTDSSETGALANTDDKKFDGFVACSKWNDEPLVSKHICRFKLGEWKNVRKSVTINGKYALDTNSYLPCKHGGIISPVTSGQEYTLSKSYNKYPKFLNDDGTVDELIIKKLLLRNMQQMKENEIDALIKLGIYLCVCTDVEKLRKIICCAYLEQFYRNEVEEQFYQYTLLDNFKYVLSWSTAYARFCSLRNRVDIKFPPTWDKLGNTAAKLKRYVNEKILSDAKPDVDRTEVDAIKIQILNVKLLDTILLAGNIYTTVSDIDRVHSIKFDSGANTGVLLYNLRYHDGELTKSSVLIQEGLKMERVDKYTVTPILQEAYIYITSGDNKFDSIAEISNLVVGSVDAKNSGKTTVITWGTAGISIALSIIPALASAPFAAPLGFACTVTGLAAGEADADRRSDETGTNKRLYLDANNKNTNVIRMSECMSLYTAITLRTTPILKKSESTWLSYKRELNNRKVNSKSSGKLTPDDNMTAGDMKIDALGNDYSYYVSVFDSYMTTTRIRNFNDNMLHLKIWNNREGRYRTISENEGLEEFQELKTIPEVFDYMNKRNDENVLYMNELDIVGHDRTGQDAKFIYDNGNGEIKEVSVDRISLVNLFGFLK
ncbi:DUF4280 domain-containing protein [Lachnoanaerobaculum sp. OBRC5-5]|uniref:DUF4280 domain-containing protein n=1 Tax=Lachnoanaerobaculum sp. OBRC5-5 TaxID=936595 RepID=UPI0002824AB8|nr:DUF4280 domain-containing protein [Lachnoanaerobaculum sp. OBRC5-5]EJZ69174.1 hypothetical protein HMPREF1135_02398 [Lachnoanaerobaculum sp. OBRC5-5]